MIIDFLNNDLTHLQPETDFDHAAVKFVQEWLSDSPTLKVQTSGSTGVPNIMEVSKQKMVASARATLLALGLKTGDSALLCLPLEYISGQMMVVRAMVGKLRLTVARTSTRPLEDELREVDFAAMTPLQVENSLEQLRLVKKLLIGGAAINPSLRKELEKLPTEVYETYGMSETLSHIALRKIAPESEEYFTIFDGIDIDTDDRSCLLISAPDLSDEKIQTNDIVEIKDGNRFRFIGRADNVINSGGVKVSPEQLEQLARHRIEREVIFAGVEDESLGQRIVAVVEGARDPEIEEQINALPYANKHHRPKEIFFAEEMPRTPNGKIRRGKLSEWIRGQQ